MVYDERRYEITLQSGRRFYAFGDGMSIDDAESDTVLYGSDGAVPTNDWTPIECAEIADAMIARWLAWKERRLNTQTAPPSESA